MSEIELSDAEKEFLKAFEAMQIIQEEPKEYRIHYEDDTITMCTMQNHPENTKYFVVDEETYNNYFLYEIVDNKLKKIDINPGYLVQLKKSNRGYEVIKNHAGIIVEPTDTHNNDTEFYAFRDN